MTGFVEPVFSGDLLVRFVVAVFITLLGILGVAMLRDNGWGIRRIIVAALPAAMRHVHRLLAMGASHRSRWRAAASARSAKLVAFANHPALVQLNLRRKMARAIDAGSRRRPSTASDGQQQFSGRLEDLAGLYLSPPEHALVWSCDASPRLRSAVGLREVPVHRRDLLGSTPLSEAVDDLCDSLIGSCALHQRHGKWLNFLRQIERASPGKQLRVLCDSQATHEHPSIRKWRAAHPRVQIQFTTASGSGLKMVKRFFDGVIAEQLGVSGFRSIGELTGAIAEHVRLGVPGAAPFVWIRQPRDTASSDYGLAAGSPMEAEQ